MALVFMDGFDKYGGVNSNSASCQALMMGDWTSVTSAGIAAPLSATGQAVTTASSAILNISRTIPTIGRIIGGVRLSSTLNNYIGVQFYDSGTVQCGVSVAATGIFSIRSGNYASGTIIASSSTAISANTTHYLEWDITIGTSAAYNVYLDGVSIIAGTGNTRATANNTVNGVGLLTVAAANSGTFDDMYVFDSTGTTNNAPLLTSPRIETTLPVSDNAVQFSVGASVLGSTVSRNAGVYAFGAGNDFYVRPFTPSRACTINSISLSINTSSTAVNTRPIVYADSAGAPGALLGSGITVTGQVAGQTLTMPLTTGVNLTAGTQYWLGFMADIAVTNCYQALDTLNSGRLATGVTFTSGAPSTAPATSTGNTSATFWGNITLTSPVNYYEVNQSPPPILTPAISYVIDGNVNDEDLYNLGPLSTPVPAVITAVAVKGWVMKSDTGTRAISLRMRSGATDSGGSLTGQITAPGNFAWMGSYFLTDPNTGAAWNPTSLNAANIGIRIDS